MPSERRFDGPADPDHPTVGERQALGRIARKEVPRSAHAGWSPRPGRPDPVSVLEAQIPSRLHDLIPIRHRRMSADAFAFYRGGAAIMAGDLAAGPTTSLTTQVCGDAHLSNFGLFGSPERALVFDLNDFDETHPGPFEWDLKRLVVSGVLLGRVRDWPRAAQRQLARQAAEGYRAAMARLAEQPNLEVWYDHLTEAQLLELAAGAADPGVLRRTAKGVEKARRNDAARAVGKFTEVVGGRRRIVHQPPIVARLDQVLPDDEAARVHGELIGAFDGYLDSLPEHMRVMVGQYRILDVALKVVGVGSVGTRCLIALAEGLDPDDLFFFQLKEAQRSVLAPFVEPVEWGNEGRRVVVGQHLMQATPDIFLGWTRTRSGDFYFRQFRDMKGGIDPARILPDMARTYLGLCGRILARAHARSGDRVAIASYLGRSDRFDRALVDFAVAYADQVEEDFARFREAIDTGRIHSAHHDL
jgi:uncharacterized protein (DUF2252 family)